MKKILVMDDEPEILEFMMDYYDTEFECEIVGKENGLEGLKVAIKEKFDLICTDHSMPEMTGAAFLKAIRTRECPNTNTPVLFISGYIGEAKKLGSEFKDVYYLQKPANLGDIFDISEKLMNGEKPDLA